MMYSLNKHSNLENQTKNKNKKGPEFMALRRNVLDKRKELKRDLTPSQGNLLDELIEGTIYRWRSVAVFSVGELAYNLGYRGKEKVYRNLKVLREKGIIVQTKGWRKWEINLGLNPDIFGQILIDHQLEKEKRRDNWNNNIRHKIIKRRYEPTRYPKNYNQVNKSYPQRNKELSTSASNLRMKCPQNVPQLTKIAVVFKPTDINTNTYISSYNNTLLVPREDREKRSEIRQKPPNPPKQTPMVNDFKAARWAEIKASLLRVYPKDEKRLEEAFKCIKREGFKGKAISYPELYIQKAWPDIRKEFDYVNYYPSQAPKEIAVLTQEEYLKSQIAMRECMQRLGYKLN